MPTKFIPCEIPFFCSCPTEDHGWYMTRPRLKYVPLELALFAAETAILTAMLPLQAIN